MSLFDEMDLKMIIHSFYRRQDEKDMGFGQKLSLLCQKIVSGFERDWGDIIHLTSRLRHFYLI